MESTAHAATVYMYAGKREQNRLSPASTGTAMRVAYTAVPAAALRCSIPVPNSTRVLAGLHSGNPLIRPISPPNRITAFTCAGQKSCAPGATHIWDICSRMVLYPPVCVIASTRPHSSSIGKAGRNKGVSRVHSLFSHNCWARLKPVLFAKAYEILL